MPLINFVLKADSDPVDTAAFRRDLTERWPELTVEDTADNDERAVAEAMGDTAPQGIDVLKVDGVMVGLAHMPGPVPAAELEGPAATSVLWPGASEQVLAHRAHTLVFVMADDTDDSRAPTDWMALLTKLTTSVLEVQQGALGVYGGGSTLLVPKEMYTDFATEVLPQGPPLDVWVDFRVGRNEDGRTSGFTLGLTELGLREIETVDATDGPGELRERLQAIAYYLLEHGPVIEHGHTVGEDVTERIRVQMTDSAFGHEGQVMRLVYEAKA